VSRDNFLFALCGLLAGFIVGYIVAGGNRPAPAAAAPPASSSASNSSPSISTSPELLQRAREVRAALEKDSGNTDLQAQLANVYYDMNDWSQAAEWYEKVLPAKKGDANLLTDLGSCYRNLGRFDRAVELYEQAQAASPGHPQSLLNLTLLYTFDMKNPEKAQTLLDRLKKEHPEIPRLDELQARISALRAAQS
jgi:tetratricopeptide (TPR) repeat protein